MRKAYMLALAAFIVIAAAVGALLLSGGEDPAAVGKTETADTATVNGNSLPQYTGESTAVGMALPEITSATPNGDSATINGPALVVVAAHWCPHCGRELPKIAAMQQNGTLTVPVYVVSTAQAPERGNWPASQWLQSTGIDATVLVDSADSKVAAALGTSSFPYMLMVDKTNTVMAQASGELSESEILELVAQAN